VLCCRATDATGASQPDGPTWNVGGYANNAVQRVPVLVR
jgi:Mo-co oxidoreductase dimerisation domain